MMLMDTYEKRSKFKKGTKWNANEPNENKLKMRE